MGEPSFPKKLFDLANVVLLVLIVKAVAEAYPKLPARIPVHFDGAGRPDAWGGRGAILVLAGTAVGLTIVFYALGRAIPRLSRFPGGLNIPHRSAFLRLPADKQTVYWAMLAEFMAGMAAGLNYLWHRLIAGSLSVALGAEAGLPARDLVMPLVVLGLVMLWYFRRMAILPGRLVRSDD